MTCMGREFLLDIYLPLVLSNPAKAARASLENGRSRAQEILKTGKPRADH
jgi:hypothetical protein